MSFEYNGVVYRDLEPQVRYDAEQIQLLKQADVTINENLQTVTKNLQTQINGKLTAPTTPTAESAVTMLSNGTVGTKLLSEIGGGKLYKHYITITFSGTDKIGHAYLTLVDNYDKSYDINKLNNTYFNNGTVYLIGRIVGNDGDGVGIITYYNDGFAYVAGVFASGSGGGTSALTGINEAPLFISSVSDTYTEI